MYENFILFNLHTSHEIVIFFSYLDLNFKEANQDKTKYAIF